MADDPTREVESVVEVLESENARLRECLFWYASCQCATLESLPERASAYQRRRHSSILQDISRFMDGARPERAGSEEWVRNRVAKSLAATLTAPKP
jgi:hypothetical protein